MERLEEKPPCLAKGERIAGCRIESFLGKGGMGEVYLAKNLSLAKQRAIKILPPRFASPDRIERFLREARTCAQVEHPNVITIHEVGKERNCYFIVMQYVNGRNLSELIRAQGGPLGWKSASNVMRLSARGLEAVHQAGLVHRDIKPSNIMVAADSRVLLMDFGLVRQESESDLTQSGQILGTPAFMSPEQCSPGKVDRRSDVYSLGSTYYFLLTGRPPFLGPKAMDVMCQIADGKVPPAPSDLNPHVPREVSQVVLKAMAPSPQDRYATADDFCKAVSALLRRATVLDETATWDTSAVASALVDTQRLPELAPLEVIPSDLSIDPVMPYQAWIVGGIATVGVLALLLLLALTRRTSEPAGHEESAQSSPPTISKTVPNAASAHSALSTAAIDQMVRIEAGYVHLGNEPNRLREYLLSIDAVATSADLLASGMAVLTEEHVGRVWVDQFFIDPLEVSNEEYARFVQATKHRPPSDWHGSSPPSGRERLPVVNIAYADAEAYAKWAGKELPTPEQWLRAFRGDSERLFPWGEHFDLWRAHTAANPSTPGDRALPVGATSGDATDQKVYDMVGNVAEMTCEQTTESGSPQIVVKGADFGCDGRVYGLAAMRRYLLRDVPDPRVGFRCVAKSLKEDN